LSNLAKIWLRDLEVDFGVDYSAVSNFLNHGFLFLSAPQQGSIHVIPSRFALNYRCQIALACGFWGFSF